MRSRIPNTRSTKRCDFQGRLIGLMLTPTPLPQVSSRRPCSQLIAKWVTSSVPAAPESGFAITSLSATLQRTLRVSPYWNRSFGPTVFSRSEPTSSFPFTYNVELHVQMPRSRARTQRCTRSAGSPTCAALRRWREPVSSGASRSSFIDRASLDFGPHASFSASDSASRYQASSARIAENCGVVADYEHAGSYMLTDGRRGALADRYGSRRLAGRPPPFLRPSLEPSPPNSDSVSPLMVFD